MNARDLTTIPLTMSTLEIAGLTGKRHKDVIRDTKLMIIDLYGEKEVDRRIPEHRRNRHREFVSEHADELLAAIAGDGPNVGHEGFQKVTWTRDNRGYIEAFNLPKRETLILVSGYSVPLRARVVDRLNELEAVIGKAMQPQGDLYRFSDSETDKRVHGGITKAVVKKQIGGPIQELSVNMHHQMMALRQESVAALERFVATLRQEQADAIAAVERQANARIEDLESRLLERGYVTVLQILKEAGADIRGRRDLNRKIGYALRREAIGQAGAALRPDENNNIWRFKREFAEAFMFRVGMQWVREHNDRVRRQGVLHLVREAQK